ncbi:MAG: hypothetical protein HQ582_29745 [Planctomycetes bacterium]|nr:hypothetical protein [Planctomycetota bacterium]
MPEPAISEKDAASSPDRAEVPFGANAVRLSPGEWVVALGLTCALMYLIPVVWERIEPFQPGPDYRLPYRLSSDYWMAARFFGRASSADRTLVVGDSAVWGHYVGKGETLSHYLNGLAGEDRFANLGIDGMDPTALSGLIEYCGEDVSARSVVLNCNLLWMSSERRDLKSKKERPFSHPRLIPQFSPRIPSYRESVLGKVGIVLGRELPFIGWTNHLQVAYFEDPDLDSQARDLFTWTIEHPYANPITLRLPSPDEPPSPEPVAVPWTESRDFNRRDDFRWVELETSFQWGRFTRTIDTLRRRGNRVFVFVGPYNEHKLTDESLEIYQARKREAEAWFQEYDIPYAIPPALASEQYADASHPLDEGYRTLAEWLWENEAFVEFREVPWAGDSR